jgi:hypothetical protein
MGLDPLARLTERRGRTQPALAHPATFSVSTRPANSRIPTCFLIPLSVRPDGPASWLSAAGPRPRRSRMPRRKVPI